MTQIAVANINLVPQGSIITFRSLNPNDTTTWIGTLESKGTYKSIRPYFDPAAYNQAVRQIVPTVSSDPTVLNYFLITVDNNAQQSTIQPFAQEWIDPGSLYIITPGNKVTVVVEDPLDDPQSILSLLASAGYSAKITS